MLVLCTQLENAHCTNLACLLHDTLHLLLCRMFPEAFTLRCFAFEPSDADIQADNHAKENLILFPPARSGACSQCAT